MPHDRIALLIEKLHSGKYTEDEQKELFDWYDSSAALEEELEKKLNENPELLTQVRDDLFMRINKPIINPAKKIWYNVSYAAASILLVLSISWWFYSKDNSITVVSNNQTERVLLPDSSVIWLKPNSRLQYSSELETGGIRKVIFEGEAFFQIRHNPEKPFEVYTENLKVKVLGTSFNLKSFPEDSLTETTLISGKVLLESLKGEKDIALAPNQHAVYSKNTNNIIIDIAEKNASAQQKKASQPETVLMVFENKPVSELLSAIERKFEVKIYFKQEEIKTCKITADLEKESLADILNLLKITQGIKHSIYKNEVFLTGNMCNP